MSDDSKTNKKPSFLHAPKLYFNEAYIKTKNFANKTGRDITKLGSIYFEFIKNNKYSNTINNFIENSCERKLIIVKFENKELKIAYADRKIAVLVLTFSSMIAYFIKNRTSRIKFRLFFPYYLFYSLLLCRENLIPYTNTSKIQNIEI
jgi:hypothetical protein